MADKSKAPPSAAMGSANDMLDSVRRKKRKAAEMEQEDQELTEEFGDEGEFHDHDDMDFELDKLLDDGSADDSEQVEDDPLFLELLQAYKAQEEEVGPPIMEKFGTLINNMFSSRMQDEQAKVLCEKYVRPENCPSMVNPRINQEIWDVIVQSPRMLDISMSKVGNKIVKSALPIVKLVDILYEARQSKKIPDTGLAVRLAMDALAIAGNALHELNGLRRQAVKRVLPERAQKLAGKVKEETALLFGSDLQQTMKDIVEGEKLGLCLEPARPKNFGPRHNAAARGQRFGQRCGAYRSNFTQRSAGSGDWHKGAQSRPHYAQQRSRGYQPKNLKRGKPQGGSNASAQQKK
ncbi:uncharacterized protein LOC135492551 [Lineus longissimus]|uniref:uncharacterized protein LOC135492551 n=1 Tax=Lineus longissimus TaxID=88925 RepID=UPI00315DC534